MRIDVVTIFPHMFPAILNESILRRGQRDGKLQVVIHDLRDYTHDRHRTVDDRPYGGGPGMIMKPEPLCEAVTAIKAKVCPDHGTLPDRCQTLLMSPTGEKLSSAMAQTLAGREHVIVLCGHYEGVDERVNILLNACLVSIGDYVLTGGELPALVLIDCVARFVPGVIGHEQATVEESFMQNLLEYPQYTRPPVFKGLEVPGVLRTGNHQQIDRWRKLQAVQRTGASRPDLVDQSDK